jgi:hypothetical protein
VCQARADGFCIVLDGWTAPFNPSYLGLIISWVEKGQIYEAVLEFIRYIDFHARVLLANDRSLSIQADRTAHWCLSCNTGGRALKGIWYRQASGSALHFSVVVLIILVQLLFLAMDNAANCDTLAEELAKLLPHFKGNKWRIRCLLHILNLIAKVTLDAVSLENRALILFQAVIAFFFKEYKRKKTAKVARGAKRKRSSGSGPEEFVRSEVEVVVEEGNTVNAEEDELADTLEGDAAEARGAKGVSQNLHQACKASVAPKGLQGGPALM